MEISNNRRILENGMPLPISFTMVKAFHTIHVPEVSFIALKTIVGELDVYYMERAYKKFSSNKTRNK